MSDLDFTQKERDAYEEFADNHLVCQTKKNAKKGVWGINLHFRSGNGVGRSLAVKCINCGKRKDITDYDAW